MFGLVSLSNDMLKLSNKIRRDVERSLNRAFYRWDLLEYDSLGFDPNRTAYRMKILTDDNGHVKVKTVKKDPGQDWETQIEEYDRGYALEQPQKQALQQESRQGQQQQQQQQQNLQGQHGQQSSLSQSHQQGKDLQQHQQQGTTERQQQSPKQRTSEEVMDIEQNIKEIADSIKKDVESSLGQRFDRWDVFDYTLLRLDPENTSYRIKILTDNNGHVNVKTLRKEPGKAWETHIEEFYKTKQGLLEKGEQKSLQGQSQEQNQSRKQDQQQQQQQQKLNQGLGQERREARSGETNLQDRPNEQKATSGSA